MPSPKSGTVVTDYEKAIKSFATGGALEIRSNNAVPMGIVTKAGKVSLGKDKLVENVNSIIKGMFEKAPAGAEGLMWKEFFLKLSASPLVNIKESVLPVIPDKDL